MAVGLDADLPSVLLLFLLLLSLSYICINVPTFLGGDELSD